MKLFDAIQSSSIGAAEIDIPSAQWIIRIVRFPAVMFQRRYGMEIVHYGKYGLAQQPVHRNLPIVSEKRLEQYVGRYYHSIKWQPSTWRAHRNIRIDADRIPVSNIEAMGEYETDTDGISADDVLLLQIKYSDQFKSDRGIRKRKKPDW